MKFRISNRKRSIILLVSFLTFVALITLVVPFLLDESQVKSVVLGQIENYLQRRVTAEGAEVTLWTGIGLRLRDAVIFEDPEFGATPFVQFEALHVRLRFFPLIFGRVEVGSIHFIKPVIRLIKNKDGVWNFESLAKSGRSQAKVSRTGGTGAKPRSLAVSRFRFIDGALAVLDATRPTPVKETRFNHVNLDLDGFSTQEAADFSFRAELPEAKGRFLRASGKLGPVDPGQFEKTHFEGKIGLERISFRSLRALLSPTDGPIDLEGYLTMESSLKGSLSEAIRLEGRTRFSNLKSNRPGRESPEIEGEVLHTVVYRRSEASIKLEKGQLSLQDSIVHLSGDITRQDSENRVRLEIDSEKASLDDLLRVASALGQGPPKGVGASGSARFRLEVTGTAQNPEVAGKASFSSCQITYPSLKEKIVIAPGLLTFTKAGLSSSELQIKVGERTQLVAKLAARFSPHKNLSFSLNSFHPVQVSDLMAIGSTFGVALPEGWKARSGTVELQLEAQKRFDGKSDLSCNGQVSLHNSELRAPLFQVPFQVKRADMKFTGNGVHLTNLAASLDGSNLKGNLQLQNFDSPSLVFNLNLDQLDLARLKNMIVSSPTAPGKPLAAVSQITGFPHKGWIGFSLGAVLHAAVTSHTASSGQDPLGKLSIRDSRITIQSVKYEALLLKNATSHIQMKNKLLELQDLQFQVNQGAHTGNASFDFTPASPQYTFTSRLKNMDANEFLSQNTSLKNLIYGTLSLDMDLKGNGSGFEEIIRNLKGDGKVSLLKGRLTSLNLNQQIILLGKLAGLKTDQMGTEINDLIGSFQVAGGRVLANTMELRTPDAVLRGSGSFGFDKTLDFQLLAELSNTLSRRYDNNSFLNIVTATFFKNEQGNIVLPLRLGGTIATPRFALDSRVVQENLKARSKEGIKKALDSLQKAFKPKTSKEADPTQETGNKPASSDESNAEKSSQPKSSPLEDLLRGVFDKAKEKKKPDKQD